MVNRTITAKTAQDGLHEDIQAPDLMRSRLQCKLILTTTAAASDRIPQVTCADAPPASHTTASFASGGASASAFAAAAALLFG